MIMTPLHNRKFIWGSIAIIVLVILLLWIQGTFTSKIAPGNTTSAYPQVSNATVTVEKKTLPIVLKWPATIASHTITRLAPKAPGRIQSIAVDIGDSVNQGQLLVQLDDETIKAQLAAAQAALRAAEAETIRATAQAKRISNLFAQEAATKQDLDAAIAAQRRAQAQTSEAKHHVAAIQAQLQNTRLHAPFSGNVIERLANPGDMGLPGQTLLTIQNPARLRAETTIPENCARLLAIGDKLAFSIPNQQLKLEAVITDMAAASDPMTHTRLVKATLPEQSGITPGAFAWAEQNCGTRDVLLLPISSIRRIGQLEQVDQVLNNTVHVRLVRTGQRYQDKIEILAGLNPGNRVLTQARKSNK